MSEFTVRISAPVMTRGGARRELPPVEIEPVGSLSWQQDIRGGMAGADIALVTNRRRPAATGLSEAFAIPPGAHVEALAGTDLVYDGFVTERTWGAGGRVVAVRVAGYEASMRSVWLRTDLTSSATAGEVLRTVLRDLAPWLTPAVAGDQWIDPQITYSNGPRDFARMKLSAIVDQIRQGGDTMGREVWVMVMPGRQVWLTPRAEPRTPDYVCPFDDRVQSWVDSLDGFATSVTVEHGTAGSGALTATASAAGLSDDAGIEWGEIVTAGNIGSAAAVALRDTELAKRMTLAVRGTLAVSRDPRTWLTTPAGEPAPYWRPRVGEWVRVGAEPMQPIVRVAVDAMGGSATYELGQPNPAAPGAFWIASRDAIARQRQMLAMTGGRLR